MFAALITILLDFVILLILALINSKIIRDYLASRGIFRIAIKLSVLTMN